MLRVELGWMFYVSARTEVAVAQRQPAVTRPHSVQRRDSGDWEGVSSIVEVVPASTGGEIAWLMELDSDNQSTYRGLRIAGCDVFANARYCPELLTSDETGGTTP